MHAYLNSEKVRLKSLKLPVSLQELIDVTTLYLEGDLQNLTRVDCKAVGVKTN
jgi:hypothetical protein